jgi:thioredoxin reductase (NADPH)
LDTYAFDVVIIGGGPAGCTCALYTARSGLSTVILDKNSAVGALAITHRIANYPGVAGNISGEALLAIMRQQAIDFGTVYQTAQVYGIEIDDSLRKVYTPEGIFTTRALVLATGAMGRNPTIKGEAEFLGRGVSYCATCDAAFYRGHEVAVYGLNQEAIAEAQVLTKFASRVHWITLKEVAQENIAAQELIAKENVKHWPQTRLLRISGDEMGVNQITVKSKSPELQLTIPVMGIFVYQSGSKPITDFIGDQVEYRANGGVAVNEEMATNVEGIWAIGDIRNTPFQQAVVAASDGCIAAMSIERYLHGRQGFRRDWEHS